MYCFKKTYNKSLEMFIERIEQELFDPENVENVRQHLARDERNALAEIKKNGKIMQLEFKIKVLGLLF